MADGCMKAMVVREFGRPLVAEERPAPVPGADQVLVEVAACGVCGTDVKVVHGRLPGVPLPVVPGHEIAGRVAGVNLAGWGSPGRAGGSAWWDGEDITRSGR